MCVLCRRLRGFSFGEEVLPLPFVASYIGIQARQLRAGNTYLALQPGSPFGVPHDARTQFRMLLGKHGGCLRVHGHRIFSAGHLIFQRRQFGIHVSHALGQYGSLGTQVTQLALPRQHARFGRLLPDNDRAIIFQKFAGPGDESAFRSFTI